MNPTHSNRRALRWLAAGAGLATALYATHTGFTWLRYGHPASPASDETDRLLDQFIPSYEAVERHHVRVAAPAEITLSAACDMDLWQSAAIRGIFKRPGVDSGQPPGQCAPSTDVAGPGKGVGVGCTCRNP
jgi:hypothetical protein